MLGRRSTALKWFAEAENSSAKIKRGCEKEIHYQLSIELGLRSSILRSSVPFHSALRSYDNDDNVDK